ncbi:MAG: ROK family protein [Clostridia bacterium]|nr:ROK family protein [Clostridia bacterium]
MVTIGIDLGGTNMAAGIVDENCRILAHASVPTGVGRPYDDIVRDMGALVNRLVAENHVDWADVRWIGVGAPGVLDNDTGTVTDNSNIRWVNYPIRQKLQQYTDKPVFLGNDANVAAWAEFVGGCGKGTKNFLLLTLGTGVGGGIVLGGKLYTGSHNTAAELGHMIFRAGGEKCGDIGDGEACGLGGKGR